jgi:adenosylhomocysteine nucleosidase
LEPNVRNGPVAILAALEQEAQTLVRGLERSALASPKLSLFEGTIEGAAVVLVITGVGKVAAALATQFVCDAFKPRSVLVVGLAGATESGAHAGQLIVAAGAVQHDVDARPLTAARGIVPGLRTAVLPADKELTDKVHAAAGRVVDQARIRSGLVLTGDQIITARVVRDGVLRDFPDGACFDMETAAIAQVAQQNGVPWAAVRITSDAADETFDLDAVFSFGTGTAADLFDGVVRATLRDL